MGLNKIGESPSYNILTPLYITMKICAEYLHCSHLEFLKLSREEKMKWYLFEEMKRRRKDYFDKKQFDAMKIRNK